VVSDEGRGVQNDIPLIKVRSRLLNRTFDAGQRHSHPSSHDKSLHLPLFPAEIIFSSLFAFNPFGVDIGKRRVLDQSKGLYRDKMHQPGRPRVRSVDRRSYVTGTRGGRAKRKVQDRCQSC
jgi:hypothetical protein